MSVTSACRDIKELKPLAQQAVTLFFQECYKAGVQVFITETYRSQARQNYLYEQGRTRPGNVITWTKSSNHTGRMAWDIAAVTVNGVTNIYDVNVLNKAGAVAKKLGITWGGSWTNNIDRPHFEIPSSWKIPSGYKIEGTLTIPTKSGQPIKYVAPAKEAAKPVAPTAPKPSTPAPSASMSTVYTVVKGDNLTKIATKYKVTVANLRSWNNLKTDVLQIGQKLNVSKPVVKYTVVKGDNLTKIANKYSTTIASIKSLNGLKSDVIQIGQVLVISK